MDAIHAAIVRILRTSDQRPAVGAGCLISSGRVLTCAHVVALAANLPYDTQEAPSGPVLLDFPNLALGVPIEGHVVVWSPPGPHGERDLAVIELLGAAPLDAVAVPMALVEPGALQGRTFRVRGFPEGYEQGYGVSSSVVIDDAVGPMLQIRGDDVPGPRVSAGFSGAPVWDDAYQAVVGMVVAQDLDPVAKVAFLAPTSELVAVWPELHEFLLPALSAEAISRLRGLLEFGERIPTPRTIAMVADITPWDIGIVHSEIAARVESTSHRLPPYVPRQAPDGAPLDAQIVKAIESGAIVVLKGPPKSGKSRTLLEAVLTAVPDAPLLVPRSAAAVQELLESDLLRARSFILWLDQLERFLGSDGLTRAALDSIFTREPPVVVVGTIGDTDYIRRKDAIEHKLDPVAELLFRRASVIDIPDGATDEERTAFARAYPGEQLEPGVGVGEHLIAARALIDRLQFGQELRPYGAAIVRAAIDWRQAGLSRPMPEPVLRDVYPVYLKPEQWPSDEAEQLFHDGLAWATTPVGSSTRLVQLHRDELGDRSVDASEYVVSNEQAGTRAADGPSRTTREMWRRLLRHVGTLLNHGDAYDIGTACWFSASPVEDIAEEALRVALESDDKQIGCRAMATLGGLLSDQGRADEAERLYRDMTGSDTRGAAALLYLALLRKQRGDLSGAEEAARQLIALRDPNQSPAGLVLLSEILESQEAPPEAVESPLREAIASGHRDYRPTALNMLGEWFLRRGEWHEAEALLKEAVATGHEEQAPVAASNLAVLLRDTGTREELEAAYETATTSSDPRIAGNAMLELGSLLARTDRAGAARELYELHIGANATVPSAAHLGLASLLLDEGNRKEAEEHYAASASDRERPFASRARLALAMLLAERGDDESSVDLLEQCLESDVPDDTAGQAALMLGRRAEETDDLDEAASLYRFARDRGDRDTYAVALYRLGRVLDRHPRQLDVNQGQSTSTILTYQPYWEKSGDQEVSD